MYIPRTKISIDAAIYLLMNELPSGPVSALSKPLILDCVVHQLHQTQTMGPLRLG